MGLKIGLAIPADPVPAGVDADLFRRYLADEIGLDDYQRRLAPIERDDPKPKSDRDGRK